MSEVERSEVEGGTGTDRWLAEEYPYETERSVPFETLSGHPIKPVYTEDDLEASGHDRERDEGFPGSYPFTRGVYPLSLIHI